MAELQGSLQRDTIKVAFSISWANPNVNSQVLTVYSGQISKWDSNRNCLVLEWLQLHESNVQIGLFTYKGSEVLYDSADTDSREKGSYSDLFKNLPSGFEKLFPS